MELAFETDFKTRSAYLSSHLMQQQTKSREFWIQKPHFLHTLLQAPPITQNQVLILGIPSVKRTILKEM